MLPATSRAVQRIARSGLYRRLAPCVTTVVPATVPTQCRSRSSSLVSERVSHFGDSVWTEFTPLARQHNAVNLSQGVSTIPVESFLLNSLTQVAREGMHHQYCRVGGHPPLVEQIARHYSPEMQRDIDPLQNICVTTGATQAIFLFCQTFINPGDEVIVLEPFYDSYIPQIEMASGKAVAVPIAPAGGKAATSADWTVDWDMLERSFNNNTKAIIVNTPHNPTGKVFSRQDLQRIADLAIKHDVLVLADQVYEMITYPGTDHLHMSTLPGMWDRTISLGSVGKAFNMTGWKLGWAIGPPDLIAPMQLTQQYIPFCVATPLQEALGYAWAEAHENGFFERQRQGFTRKRDGLVEVLQECGLTPTVPEASYFILADTSKIDFPENYSDKPPNRRDYQFCRWLTAEIGVAAIPPSCFYTPEHAHLAANFARFCFAKSDDDLEAAKQRLTALKQYARS